MEWFRHFSDADTSLKLNALIDQMGVKGYGQYWLLFGLLNKKFDGVNYSSIKVHEHEILGKLRARYVGPMRELLGSMAGLELFQYTREDRIYIFSCPMLLDLMSKDSKYNRSKRFNDDPSAKPRYKNKEVDIDNTPLPPKGDLGAGGSGSFDPRKFLSAKKILSQPQPEIKRKITPDEVVDLWNRKMGPRFGHAVGLGGGKHLQNCLKAFEFLPELESWEKLFEECLKHPRLTGGGEIDWTVTLTWIVDYDNALKVLNGDFDDSKAVKNLFASINTQEVV